MEHHFDKDLMNLKRKLVEMSVDVEKMLSLSISVLLDKNQSLIQEMTRLEDKVNKQEVDVENEAITLIARHQPAAKDLRFIIAVIEMSRSLERIGDLSINVVERCDTISDQLPKKHYEDLKSISLAALKMVNDAVESFINLDEQKALDVCSSDDEVDDLKETIFKKILRSKEIMQADLESLIDIVIVSRQYERVADMATNLAEEVVYQLKGKIIKHHFTEDEN